MIAADVLVIGAGISGLTIASALHKQGKTILCVEKARGSGGRLSSKRQPVGDDYVQFDLGCTAFTARTPKFKQQVSVWCDAGAITTWVNHNDEHWYVGTPRSSSITRLLANELPVQFSTRVTRLERHHSQWAVYIEGHNSQQCYALVDDVVISAPAPQCYALLPSDHALKSRLGYVTMGAQWVIMLALKDALNINDFCVSPNDVIASISYENSKPNRQQGNDLHVYCVQASVDWSNARMDYSKDKILMELTNAFAEFTQQALYVEQDYCHRWLYSQGNENGYEAAGFLTSTDGIHICGDYLVQDLGIDGVEAAYLSAMALTDYLSLPVLKQKSV